MQWGSPTASCTPPRQARVDLARGTSTLPPPQGRHTGQASRQVPTALHCATTPRDTIEALESPSAARDHHPTAPQPPFPPSRTRKMQGMRDGTSTGADRIPLRNAPKSCSDGVRKPRDHGQHPNHPPPRRHELKRGAHDADRGSRCTVAQREKWAVVDRQCTGCSSPQWNTSAAPPRGPPKTSHGAVQLPEQPTLALPAALALGGCKIRPVTDRRYNEQWRKRREHSSLYFEVPPFFTSCARIPMKLNRRRYSKGGLHGIRQRKLAVPTCSPTQLTHEDGICDIA